MHVPVPLGWSGVMLVAVDLAMAGCSEASATAWVDGSWLIVERRCSDAQRMRSGVVGAVAP